ncbi:MAG: carboxypeptidase-like regulatory domain-containing protein [Limisphaerales bacterium]
MYSHFRDTTLGSADSGICLTGTPRLFEPESGHVMGKPRLQPWKYCTTDAQGRFSLDVFDAPIFLLVAQDSGFARIEPKEFSTNMTVKLEGWGRIKGVLWDYDQVVPNQLIRAGIFREDSSVWGWATAFKTNTDERGRFTFEFVPPGLTSIDCSGVSETVLVKPGQTSVVKLDGKGRSAIGKLTDAASNQKPEEISGRIVDPRGQPVSGAQVAVVKPDFEVDLGIGKSRLFNPQVPHLFGESRVASLPWNYCTTDAQGRFYLNDLAGALHLVAAHEKGYAEIAAHQFSTNMAITLEPCGRIEGTLRYYDEVLSNDTVSIGYVPTSWFPHRPSVDGHSTFKTGTDDHGHYSFDFVRPGQYEVFGSRVRERAAINANETTVRNIGGPGRPVIGKFKIRNPYIRIDWGLVSLNIPDFGFCYFCTEPPMPAEPFKSRQDYLAWRKQRDVERTLGNNDHGHEVRIAKDGSFRIDQVEPGKYELELSLWEQSHLNFRVAKVNYLAEYDGYDRTFEIPASESNAREPLDLGVIEISLKPQETIEKQ